MPNAFSGGGWEMEGRAVSNQNALYAKVDKPNTRECSPRPRPVDAILSLDTVSCTTWTRSFITNSSTSTTPTRTKPVNSLNAVRNCSLCNTRPRFFIFLFWTGNKRPIC